MSGIKYDPPKKHWLKEKWKIGSYEGTIALCGHTGVKYANAKRKVTCLRCLKSLGNPLTLGDKK
jgi:hypothetical protein